MTLTQLIFPRSEFAKITNQYNENLEKRLDHKGMKSSGKILLGRLVDVKNDDKIYFHPARANSTIDTSKTLDIFLSISNYSGTNLTTLNYGNGPVNKRILRLEYGSNDIRLDLVPLFFIDDKTNLVYIEVRYTEGMLKYYMVLNSNVFEFDISEDLPLLDLKLNQLNTNERNPISMLDEKELEWYGKYSNPNNIKKEINLLIGEIDFNIVNQSTNAFIFNDLNVGEFKLNNRIKGADESISIFAKGNDITPVFKASIDVGTSRVITIQEKNDTQDGLFYYCKISGGTDALPIKGIKIDTQNPTQFGKLTARINFINNLLAFDSNTSTEGALNLETFI